MNRALHNVLLSVFVLANIAMAQHSVPPHLRYHRLICVVPVIGTGKSDDPIRPQYAPRTSTGTRTDIFAFSFQLSDDKTFALVEYVAADRAAFAALLADKNPSIRVFERGKQSRASIETELRKWKKDIDLDHFGVDAR